MSLFGNPSGGGGFGGFGAPQQQQPAQQNQFGGLQQQQNPLGGIGGGSLLGAPQAKPCETNGCYELPNCPDDSISCCEWSVHNHLACGSWDKSVRIWQVQAQPLPQQQFGGQQDPRQLQQGVSAQLACQYTHDAPVLSVAFTKDGMNVISGGCDNKIKMKNLQVRLVFVSQTLSPLVLSSDEYAEFTMISQNQQERVVGQHDAPVKEVAWCEEMQCIISGSWDKSIRFWDGKSS